MIEVEEFKKKIKELYGYSENDKSYIFYYDETNNYRKVRITERGFNNENILKENYILGGLCINKECSINIASILDDMKIQPSQEIKSRMFFRGKNKFEECISNKNLTIVLDWIVKNAFIHYLDMDNFFFTVIDVVDSLVDDSIVENFPKDMVDFMKNELYLLLKINMNYFIDLCNRTNYPNINENNVELFCNGIISLINLNMQRFDDEKKFFLEMLRQLLKDKRKSRELVFLKNNEDKTIVEGYYGNRQQRCIIFQNSKHIFDKEDKDEKAMTDNLMVLKDGNLLKNYKFVDSKEYLEIQISDIIVSIIAKYLSFLSNNSVKYIDGKILNLNNTGKINLKKLIEIINKSDKENNFFIATVNPFQVINYRDLMNQHVEFLLNFR